MNVTSHTVAPDGSLERRETPPITLPAPPAVIPEPISELRQEIAGMHVPNSPTWQDEVAALGHRGEELARRHPGAAVLACMGLGFAVGGAMVWLARRHATPQERAKRSLHDFGAALHDLLVPAANHAVHRSADATAHGLHAAGKKLEAAAQSNFLDRLKHASV